MSGLIRGNKPKQEAPAVEQAAPVQESLQQNSGAQGPQSFTTHTGQAASYLNSMFSAQLGRTESGAVLTNAVEAIKKFLVDKGMDKDTNRDGLEYRVIGIDGNEIHSYASAVSICAIGKSSGKTDVFVHTMILGASQSEEIQSATVNLANRTVEVPQTLHDIIDDNFRRKVRNVVAPNLYMEGEFQLYDAGFVVLPKSVVLNDDTKENQERLNARMFYASAAIRSLRAEVTSQTSLDLTKMLDSILVVREDLTPAMPAYDANGNPVRTDVRVTCSAQFNDEDGRQRQLLLADVAAAVSLAYQPTNQGYGVMDAVTPYQQAIQNQAWIPTVTITRNDTGTPNITLAQNLLGIAVTAITIGSHLKWSQVFYMNRTKPHMNLGNLPLLDGNEPIDLTSADVDIVTYRQVLAKYVRENPVFLYQVDRFDELSATNDVLLMAANGDQTALDNIYQELNDLCGGKMSNILPRANFDGKFVGTIQQRRVLLGSYVPSHDGVPHDRREIDMLSILSSNIPNSAIHAMDLYVADNNPDMPANYRADTRQKLDASITSSSLTQNGFAYELILSNAFLELLVAVISATQISVQRRSEEVVNEGRVFFNSAMVNNAVQAGLGQGLMVNNFGYGNQNQGAGFHFGGGRGGW